MLSTKAIARFVRCFVQSDQADIEDLVHDIWLLCETKGYKPSKKLVRNVCTDWLRRRRVRDLGVVEIGILSLSRAGKSSDDTADYINALVREANLTRQERFILWNAFWLQDDLWISTHKKELEMVLDKLYMTIKKGALS